jgi:hypothetical protein
MLDLSQKCSPGLMILIICLVISCSKEAELHNTRMTITLQDLYSSITVENQTNTGEDRPRNRSSRIFQHYTDSSIDSTWADFDRLDRPIRSISGSRRGEVNE